MSKLITPDQLESIRCTGIGCSQLPISTHKSAVCDTCILTQYNYDSIVHRHEFESIAYILHAEENHEQ
jgi:hypothetical protein